jgi:hypothetical protein
MQVIYVLLRLVGSTFSLGVSVLITVVIINNMSSFYSRLGYKLLCK